MKSSPIGVNRAEAALVLGWSDRGKSFPDWRMVFRMRLLRVGSREAERALSDCGDSPIVLSVYRPPGLFNFQGNHMSKLLSALIVAAFAVTSFQAQAASHAAAAPAKASAPAAAASAASAPAKAKATKEKAPKKEAAASAAK